MLTRLDKPSVSILITAKAVTADSTPAPNSLRCQRGELTKGVLADAHLRGEPAL